MRRPAFHVCMAVTRTLAVWNRMQMTCAWSASQRPSPLLLQYRWLSKYLRVCPSGERVSLLIFSNLMFNSWFFSQLDCTHVFHLQCTRRVLENRWLGPRITFGFMLCPICKVWRYLSHADRRDKANTKRGCFYHALKLIKLSLLNALLNKLYLQCVFPLCTINALFTVIYVNLQWPIYSTEPSLWIWPGLLASLFASRTKSIIRWLRTCLTRLRSSMRMWGERLWWGWSMRVYIRARR